MAISEEHFFFVGYKENRKHIIAIDPEVVISRPYLELKPFRQKFTLAYFNETQFDMYDIFGKLLYSNITYFEDNSIYLLIRANGYEYWLTQNGEEYARHKIPD